MDREKLISGMVNITEREIEVLFYWVQGSERKEIAKELSIGEKTVDSHIGRIVGKLPYPDADSVRDIGAAEILEIIPNLDAVRNWDVIQEQLKNELHELTAKGKGSVWIDKDGKPEVVEQPPPPPDTDSEDEEEEDDEDGESDELWYEHLLGFIRTSISQITDSETESPRLQIALIGVIVLLVIVVGFLLIQRGRETATTQGEVQAPPVQDTLEPVVVVVQITATPLPPPPTPEVTIIEQVVIPDTEVPPPPTVIPTETLNPTITFTPTITYTPTIAPTDVEVGPDNLPLKFEGTMTQSYFGTFPMIFYIEERNGDRVSGKTHYPELYNLIYGWEGEIIHDFGDITEESKWMKLEAYGSEGGTWIKETRRWNIQGTNSATDGNYYLYISDTGKVTGSWFRWNNVEPGPPFTLYITEYQ